MLLLGNWWPPLLLAAAVYIVVLVSSVGVLAFTAIELIPLPPVGGPEQ
jgi:hypothetical protein